MKLNKKVRNFFGKIPLKFNIWLYFIAFTIIVFVLLWTFQILFLERFYEQSKVHDVDSIAEQIIYSYENDDIAVMNKKLEKLAYENDLCVSIVDKYNRTRYWAEHSGDCLIHGPNNSTFIYTKKIDDNNGEPIWRKDVNPRNRSNMVLFGTTLKGSSDRPDGYLLINTTLVPVGSTVNIIKRQLMIITAILIIFAFIISLLMSNRISLPIDRITASAENLAKGDFNTKFDGRGYLEAKKLADTLTYAEKELSRVDTMQRDLIANVSHDLRTPLTMLKAYAEMIRDLSGDNPVKRNEHLEIIINETDRLSLMVNDILDLSKLESGKETLHPSTFLIGSKLNEIIDRFKGISEKMGYNIHFTPDEERTVKCDVVKIEQVIYNLINNAINYTGDDKQVFVRQINKPEGVVIEVSDTGKGIEEDKIKLIFDKNYRSENHKREVVGTGLGLSIVKAVLKLHNYDYGVRSKLGEGSTFWFMIAAKDVQNAQSDDKNS
ncbi:MAG: HAMP domain-containing histidine kinase [Ruminococcus sp.]|nr:HAMP domain-containing histidine kinase [Ruminococcus sp.]